MIDSTRTPTTIAEAEAWLLTAQQTAVDIQAQLTARNAEVEGRGRIPDSEFREYREWRGRAVWAHRAATNEVRRLKSWIKSARQSVAGQSEGLGSDLAVVSAAVQLLRRLRSEIDGGFTGDEMAVLDALDKCRQRLEIGARVAG